MQQANMSTQQCADDLITKLCKVAAIYNEGTLNEVSIKEVDQSIRHSLQNYWETSLQAELTYIAFQVESPLSIQQESKQQPAVIQQSTASSKPYCNKA